MLSMQYDSGWSFLSVLTGIMEISTSSFCVLYRIEPIDGAGLRISLLKSAV